MTHTISLNGLLLEQIPGILTQKLSLGNDCLQKINVCRAYLDKRMASQSEAIYGINTGFGALYNTVIAPDDLEQLQENLVMSHACGLGDEVPKEIVKIMLLLKAQGLAFGHSGVTLATVEQLISFYNHDILPVIYQQGSLGASGDLSPLAHLSMALIGKGEVYFQGTKMPSEQALQACGLQPLKLKSKEGLALLNGTQFMSAYGVCCILKAQNLDEWADTIAAISLDAYDGRIEPFYEGLHTVRKQNGQLLTARRINSLLAGSEIANQAKQHVQDPYSFRCIPQVHGATKDALNYVAQVFENEINSVTDNPTIFPEQDLILSGGNFHGQPLAISLDFLAIALAELGNIAERRVYQLISGKRNLPPFLVAKPGLNSGLMIAQYTAASIVSQNKQLCTPASVDSIESSNGQEDHVSMGANAATKCFKVIENVEKVLAIELLNATQALAFRQALKTSKLLESLIAEYRKNVAFINTDRYLHPEIMKSINFISTFKLTELIKNQSVN